MAHTKSVLTEQNKELLSYLKNVDRKTYYIYLYVRTKSPTGGVLYNILYYNLYNYLFNLLLRCMDKKSAEKLETLTCRQGRITSSLCRKTGWTVNDDGAIKRDNFRNMNDPEFREWDTYRLKRDETGYHPADPDRYYKEFFYEQTFAESYQKELQELNEIVIAKRELLNGEYELSDTSISPRLPLLLIKELGYRLGNSNNKGAKEKIK